MNEYPGVSYIYQEMYYAGAWIPEGDDKWRAPDIRRLIRAFKMYLEHPAMESYKVMESVREWRQHLIHCIDGYRNGGDTGFCVVWNEGRWLLTDQEVGQSCEDYISEQPI